MHLSARSLVLIAVCGLAMLCTACSSNSKKIVGKWKIVSMAAKDGKEMKFDFMGLVPIMEFTADGVIKAGMDLSNVGPEFKQKMESDKEAAAKMAETHPAGKYKISGNKIEFMEMKESGDASIGKKSGGTLSFDGDNLTITGDDGTMKLTRIK